MTTLRHRTLAAGIAVAGALALTACGGMSSGGPTVTVTATTTVTADAGTPEPAPSISGETEAPPVIAGDVTIVASNFWADKDYDENTWNYAFVAENESSVAQEVEISVDALNAAGEIVSSDTAYFIVVGSTFGGKIGYFFDVPAREKIASLEFTIEAEASYFGSYTLEVSDVEDEGDSVSGRVTTNSPEQLEDVLITVLRVDGDTIIGGGETYVDRIKAESSSLFNVSTYIGESGGTEVIAFAAPELYPD